MHKHYINWKQSYLSTPINQLSQKNGVIIDIPYFTNQPNPSSFYEFGYMRMNLFLLKLILF
jgi:hypothetical protein